MEKNLDPGLKKFGSGIEKIGIPDPGLKNFGSGINIPDPQHWFRLLSANIPGL
jgi:hypothetical protein